MYGATMSDDKFNKEYKYNIRHTYGQEGKRANYPPKRYVPLIPPTAYSYPIQLSTDPNAESTRHPGLTRMSIPAFLHRHSLYLPYICL